MVSGLTPPSKRKDKLDLRTDIDELREIVRTGSSTTGIMAISGGVGTGDTPITGSSSVGGMISMQPEVCYQSVIIKINVTIDNFGSNPAHDLPIGGIIQSSRTISGEKWRGQLLFWLDEEAGSGAEGMTTKIGVFEPCNPAQLNFENQTQTFIQKDENNVTISGWTAAYVTGDTNEFNDKVLPIKTSTSIVEAADGGNAEIQLIKGSMSNGQIITLKPRQGKSLLLKAGGNIDIASDLTIADNEVAMLQMFWDANHSVKFTGGGSGASGAKAVAYVEDDDGATTTAQKGKIQSILVTHGGEGYTTEPTVTMEGGTGTIPSTALTAVIEDGSVIEVTTTNGNPVGSGWEQTGRFILLKTQSSGTTDTTIDYVWTGRHKFHADPAGTHPLYNDATEAHTVEFGNAGTDRIMFIGEITGKGAASITNPDGGANIPIPGSDPSLNIKSALVMNTYDIYDLDKLVFSQSQSTQTPAPEADWNYIEADTGTDENQSPLLHGMNYNVPSGKIHKFKINQTDLFTMSQLGFSFFTNMLGPSDSGVSIWRSDDDMLFNVGDTNFLRFEIDGDEKIKILQGKTEFNDAIYLTSNNEQSAYIDFKKENASDVLRGVDLNPEGTADYDDLVSNHGRLFMDDQNSDHLSFYRKAGSTVTLKDLEGGGGVEANENITWSGEHVWGTYTDSSPFSDDEQIFNTVVKFHKDGEDDNFDDDTEAGVVIGMDGNDKCKFNGFIMGETEFEIKNPDGSGSTHYDLSETEHAINVHSSLVMNTYSIWGLDQLIFSKQPGTDDPEVEDDWWNIEVEDETYTNYGQGEGNLNYNVPNGEFHCFNVKGKSQVQIGGVAGESNIYMNGGGGYNSTRLQGLTGTYGGLRIMLTDTQSGSSNNLFDVFINSEWNYSLRVQQDGIKLNNSGYIHYTTNYYGSSDSGAGSSSYAIYPDRWIKFKIGSGSGNTVYVPCYYL